MLTVTIGGADYSNRVIAYTRQSNICGIMCDTTLNLVPCDTNIDPYTEVLVDYNGQRRFTGYVSGVVRSRRGEKYTLHCVHKALKRFRDYWFVGDFATETKYGQVSGEETSAHFATRLCSAVGATHTFNAVIKDMPYNVWTNANAATVLEDLLTFGGMQCIPKEDGSIEFSNLQPVKSGAIDLTDVTASCSRRTGDEFFRTDIIVMGNGIYYAASGSNPYGLRRKAVLANSLIGTDDTAITIGDAMLKEFNQLVETQSVSLVGIQDISLGDTVKVVDRKDAYSNYAIATTLGESADDRGMVMDVITNQRCPRIWGFSFTLFDVYEHIPFAIGTSLREFTPGVWFSVFDEYISQDSARVWVTPDLSPALPTPGSGSGFQDGSVGLEWYDCSEGLTGDFWAYSYCFGSDCPPNYGFSKPALVRDYWSENGRGAWCSTTTGIFYTPQLLPPTGQASGSWAYTPWTQVYARPNLIESPSETKANDSTGLMFTTDWYCGWIWIVNVMQVGRGGATEVLASYPSAPYAANNLGLVGNFTKPYTTNPQYLTCFANKYSDPGAHHITFVNRAEFFEENIGNSGYPLIFPGPSETDAAGNFLLFPPYSPNVYTTPSGLTIKSTFPDNFRTRRDVSYDAKHERLYVMAQDYPVISKTAILRSDDDGVTWSKKATSGSEFTNLPGVDGVMTSRILANRILPYVTTYCVQATTVKRASGSYSIMVSGNDGVSFNADLTSFGNEIWCMMDMATG